MRFLATVSKGLEQVVADELRGLGLAVLDASPGLVAFKGKREDAWRACLHLRAARRVLWPLGSFEAGDQDALYEGAKALPWGDLLTAHHTFAVEASIRDSAFGHSGFVALKVKDAIADALREGEGERPDVDRADPDVSVVVHVGGSECSVSLDVGGGPLHKRGYRAKSVAAPLNETLAAGILLLAGYDGTVPFADPFCGSGTLLIEAALIATRTAPGLLRKKPFGFQRWPGFKPNAWADLAEEAASQVVVPTCRICGSDADRVAVSASRANAKTAGVAPWIATEVADVSRFTPPGAGGLIATNPPYGDHAGAGEDLAALYRTFGDALKRRCAGWRACVLSGNPALVKTIGLHPKRKIPLFNGPLPCKLLVFEMYEGSKRSNQGDRESVKGWSQRNRETGKQGKAGEEPSP